MSMSSQPSWLRTATQSSFQKSRLLRKIFPLIKTHLVIEGENMLDTNTKLIEGKSDAGIYDDGTSYSVVVNGNQNDSFGRDIEAARKYLKEQAGRDA